MDHQVNKHTSLRAPPKKKIIVLPKVEFLKSWVRLGRLDFLKKYKHPRVQPMGAFLTIFLKN